ncbi:hypothetical protein [Ruegeria jejuensis]|uniref:hypothetical protein n=1 Tax=Ruegeria jejuensis TaxID=3233338 RepID=UPI00355B037E
MKIAYEPHPVAPDRKAELRKQGFKIIDAKFRPVDQVEPITRESIAKMPKAKVLAYLAEHGIDDAEGKVADLRELLTNVMFTDL